VRDLRHQLRGLKRRGFTPEAIAALKRAYKTLYKSGLSLADARAELETQAWRDA
jgi:UDP-N-acetylglucosamine acyltransferase